MIGAEVMKATKITNRNTMFSVLENENSYVHMGVIRGVRHNFIIDIGIGGDCAKAMLEYIGNDKPLIIVNTHHDWDHAAGNWLFDGRTIIGHKLCPALMDANWDNQLQHANLAGGYFCGIARKTVPSLLFDGEICFPEDGISIFHTPGHTADSISVFDAVDKVLFTGDNFGVSDGKAQYWGASDDAAGFRRLIETYKQLDFETCISGHSAPQTRQVIAMLEAALADMSSHS